METIQGKKSSGKKTSNAPKKIVLVDMDGVIANFELEVLSRFRDRNPKKPFIPFEDREGFYVAEDYKKRGYDHLMIRVCDLSKYFLTTQSITEESGFFRSIPPIEGALEALLEMKKIPTIDIFFCTR